MSTVNSASGPITLDRDKLVADAIDHLTNGNGKHHRLPDADLADIVGNVRVRIAGWRDGERTDPEEEVRTFQRLEAPFVTWRTALATAADLHLPKDEFGLNTAQWAAINEFHERGGHVSQLSREKILYIMQHGIIAFLELEVRQGVFATLGSVSALSSTPYTTQEADVAKGGDGLARDPITGLHGLWPNYDWRDVKAPGMLETPWIDERGKRLLIVRSTIHDKLQDSILGPERLGGRLPDHLQNRELRRLGLAGLGKAHIFHIAQDHGSQRLTFNIGTISHPRERTGGMRKANKPSTAHNDWMQPLSWRRYYDVLLENPDYVRQVAMFWRAYDGEIAHGLEEFEGEHGLLTGKGWNVASIRERAAADSLLVRRDFAEGRRAPWQQLAMPTQLCFNC